jgi:hypothetical protein
MIPVKVDNKITNIKDFSSINIYDRCKKYNLQVFTTNFGIFFGMKNTFLARR